MSFADVHRVEMLRERMDGHLRARQRERARMAAEQEPHADEQGTPAEPAGPEGVEASGESEDDLVLDFLLRSLEALRLTRGTIDPALVVLALLGLIADQDEMGPAEASPDEVVNEPDGSALSLRETGSSLQ